QRRCRRPREGDLHLTDTLTPFRTRKGLIQICSRPRGRFCRNLPSAIAGFTPWLLAGPRGLLKSGTRDADGTNSRRGRLDRPGLLADLHGVGAAASRPEPWMTEVATDDKQPSPD